MKKLIVILVSQLFIVNYILSQPIQGFLLNKGFDVKKRELDFTVGSLFMVYHMTYGINSKLNVQTGINIIVEDFTVPIQVNYKFSNYKNLSHLASINFSPYLYLTSGTLFSKIEYSIEKKIKQGKLRSHLGFNTYGGWHVYTFQFLWARSLDAELEERLTLDYGDGYFVRCNSPYIGFSSDLNLSPHWFFKNEIYLNQLKTSENRLPFLLACASLSMRYGWFGMDAGAFIPLCSIKQSMAHSKRYGLLLISISN
jgi:hypothetical protein